jgi:PAS domain S-box-containing protein
LEKEVSCRVTSTLIKYVDSMGVDISSFLEGMSYSRSYLENPLNWIPADVRDRLGERTAKILKDEKVMYQVGLRSQNFKPNPGLEKIVRLLGNPQIAYTNLPRFSSHFDRSVIFEVDIAKGDSAIIRLIHKSGKTPSIHTCYYAQGALASIPVLWDLPPAEIEELECGCKSGSTNKQGNTPSCLYKVKWKSGKKEVIFNKAKLGNSNNTGDPFDMLESSFELADRKNRELAQRNLHLTKVREISAGITTAKTVDDVFKLIVNLAMDIPQISLLMVQKADLSGGFFQTPYYSKFRDESVIPKLKAMGFDSMDQFNLIPQAGKSIFEVTQIPIVNRVMNDPSIIVLDRLSEVLRGLWPPEVCDQIQSIIDFKKIVIVPLAVDNQPCGSLIFHLKDDLPMDIIEMIGNHCCIALKNVITLQNLDRDINERKKTEALLRESEKKYRLIAENTNDFISIIDFSGNWVYLSPSFKALGYEPEKMMGKPAFDLIHPDDIENVLRLNPNHPDIKKIDTARIKEQNKTKLTELRFLDASGIWHNMEVSANLLEAQDGKGFNILTIARDITARKQAQDELEILYQTEKNLRFALEKEINTRAEFFRALVHELKTPLTPVVASSETMMELIEDKLIKKLAENVYQGATRLNNRVDELLDISRGEMGMLKLDCQPMDMAVLIKDTASYVNAQIKNNHQTLKMELPETLHQITADESRLRQVLLNLLNNSIKFTPTGGEILIRARSDQEFLVVEVQDTGSGIDESEQARLFQPYNRIESDRQHFSGLGLGLALSKQLIDLHGGKINVVSQKGKGSTFSFSLPVKPPPPAKR